MSEAAVLERWPVALEVAVAWGEMDAFGHVNNTVYLKWCESARIVYFERTGMLEVMKRDGVGPILAQALMNYRRPVTYPDTLRVEATVSKVGNTSFTLKYRLTSQAHRVLVADGESVAVLYDYRAGTKTPISAGLREKIFALERSGAGGT
jgi:acyl-CoA thioester hydrolase